MIIYECDMCKRHFNNGNDLRLITVGGNDQVMICDECARNVGEYIRAYKSRESGMKCTVDTKFGGGGKS